MPASLNLGELHDVIQIAMGWTNSHLHEFDIGGVLYGEPDPDADVDLQPEHRARLTKVAPEGTRMRYVYDFGDNWRHDVLVEKVTDEQSRLVCLAGRRACPPEDVGGPWGYQTFLEAYGDSAHPDHRDMREWAGEGFDPDRFDPAEVTGLLQQLAR